MNCLSNDLERLYVAQALYKAMGKYVSTTEEGLRTNCDAELLKAYRRDGVKSLDAKINDICVGTYSVAFTKETTTNGLRTIDEDALVDWAQDNGFVREVIDYDAIKQHFATTGEVPDGCVAYTETSPKTIKGTTLRIDPIKVSEALSGSLPQAVVGLLEGQGA